MGALDLFADVKDVAKLITTYRVKLLVDGVIVGGVPSNPSVIKSWLTARLDMGDAALEELLDQTIKERNGSMSVEEKVEVLAKSPVAPSVNGFKRNGDGILCYEGRCMKAALKEAANSAFPGTDWPGKSSAKGVAPRKGLMSTLVERVFVPQLLIPLVVEDKPVHTDDRRDNEDPTPGGYAVEERVKHVVTAQGPRSAINIVEVVRRPTVEFELVVHDDFMTREAWAKIWTRLEDIGIGADRGRSDGSFELLAFDKVEI